MKFFIERLKEPSTYQGLALIAGVIGQRFAGSEAVGQLILDVALAVAGVIWAAKPEAIVGRDYSTSD